MTSSIFNMLGCCSGATVVLGIVPDLLEQLEIFRRQGCRKRVGTFGDDIFCKRVERERFEFEAERVNLARVGRVFTVKVEWTTEQLPKVLHGNQVPHLLTRDLEHEIL